MNGTNLVVVSGSIGKDPQTRLAGENTLMEFSIAVNKTFKKKGEKVENTIWLDIKVWGDKAKSLAFLKKGNYVIIQGELVMETWTDKESGKVRNKIKIEANTVNVFPSHKSGENGEKEAAAQQAEQYATAESATATSESFVNSSIDDDLPF